MPATLTYNPLTPQKSAEFLRPYPRRYARYAEIHTVPPLKGLGEPRAASGSYRALAPGGETLPCGIKGDPSVLPKPIPNSKFLILHWTFTFSAKEKDSETGLSYFGSRYYSSDLSIWLSVDPMSGKYPSLSPYTYCADNPVRLVDPNGEAWDIDGNIYIPGENCPDDVSNSTRDKWNTMNEIYKTENGKTIIDALNGNDCLYHVSSDIKSDGKGGFSSKDKTIYLNGNDREVGTLAHEMFHAYQDYNGRSEASIFNEVEANLFSFSVLWQQCESAGNCIFTPKHSPLVNGEPTQNSSEEYKRYFGDASYLLLGNFNREKFNNVVSGFLEYSKQNKNGKYNNGYKPGGDIYEDTLIEKIFK